MKVDDLIRSFVVLDTLSDMTPIVSTVKNVAFVILKMIFNHAPVLKHLRICKILDQKTYLECFIKMIPGIGQLELLKYLRSSGQSFFKPIIQTKDAATQACHPSSYYLVANHLKTHPLLFDYIPGYLSLDHEFIKYAASLGVDVSESQFFRSSKEIQLSVLRHHPSQIKKLSRADLQVTPYECPAILAHAPLAFNWDQDLLVFAIDHLSADELSKIFKQLNNLMRSGSTRRNPLTLNYTNLTLDQIFTLLKKAPQLTQSFISRLDHGFCLKLINQNGLFLEHVPAALRSEDIIDASLLSNPLALAFVPDALKTTERFNLCCARNPLSWQFGSEANKQDTDLHIRVITLNPKSDPDLYHLCSGNLFNMKKEVYKNLLSLYPSRIQDIPEEYRFDDEILKFTLEQALRKTAHELCLILHMMGARLPAYIKYESLQRLTSCCQRHLYLGDGVERSNLTAASLTKSEPLIYRSVSSSFMTRFKKPFLDGTYDASSEDDWTYVFDKLVQTYPENETFVRKYGLFVEESDCELSAQGEMLKAYYIETKSHLKKIAGYLKAHPEDHTIIERLRDTFSVCPGGIQANLPAIVDEFCEFSGTPPLSYRVAKIVHKFAINNISQVAITTYPARISNDVHVINRLKREFNRFTLDQNVQDPIEYRHFENRQLLSFFEHFNAKTVFEAVIQETKTSSSFKQSFRDHVKHHIDDFLPPEKHDIISRKLKDLEIKTAFSDAFKKLPAFFECLAPYHLSNELLKLFYQLKGMSTMTPVLLKSHLKRHIMQDIEKNPGAYPDYNPTNDLSDYIDSLDVIKNKDAIFAIFSTHKRNFAAIEACTKKNLLELKTLIETHDIDALISDLVSTDFPQILKEEALIDFFEESEDEKGDFKWNFLINILDHIGFFAPPRVIPEVLAVMPQGCATN